MTRKYFTIIAVLLGLVGCRSYKDIPYVVYHGNKIDEYIKPMNYFYICNYNSTIKAIMDDEECIPAHFQIWMPPRKDIRNIYGSDFNRCFIFTKKRGIAFFQDIHYWERKYACGLRQISKDSVVSYMSAFGDLMKVNVMEQKNHYLYVNHEIRIVFFNLSKEDYSWYVEFPLMHLEIRRHGEVRKKQN